MKKLSLFEMYCINWQMYVTEILINNFKKNGYKRNNEIVRNRNNQ